MDSLLQAHLQNIFGDNYPDFINALKQDPITSIRLNSKKHLGKLTHSKVPWTTQGYYLEKRPSFIFDPLLHGGTYYVQEASSMFLEFILKQIKSTVEINTALDLCAAPGGKSIILSDVLSESLIVCNEVIQTRVNILKENLIKWGNANYVITNSDAKHFSNLDSFFDLILIDAPCSGEGMFRKDHKAMDEWNPNLVDLCTARQKRILADVYNSLGEEGILIYSTCTYNAKENIENIQWLCDEFGFEVLNFEIPNEWGITKNIVEQGSSFSFYPHKTKGEGFFICALKANKNKGKVQKRKHTKLFKLRDKEFSKEALPFNWREDFCLINFKNEICLVDEKHLPNIELLLAHLNIQHIALSIGSFKHSSFIPSHDLALQSSIKLNAPRIALDYENAIQFFKCGAIKIDTLNTGWHIVAFNESPLGWIKIINANRINNYYPEHYRILKAMPSDFNYEKTI